MVGFSFNSLFSASTFAGDIASGYPILAAIKVYVDFVLKGVTIC